MLRPAPAVAFGSWLLLVLLTASCASRPASRPAGEVLQPPTAAPPPAAIGTSPGAAPAATASAPAANVGPAPAVGEVVLAEPTGDDRARCDQIDAVWNAIPDAHRQCQADAHCELISAAANCFHRALNQNAMPAYRTFLEAHGAGCMYGVMGMCPPDPDRAAACQQGRCVVMPDAKYRP